MCRTCTATLTTLPLHIDVLSLVACNASIATVVSQVLAQCVACIERLVRHYNSALQLRNADSSSTNGAIPCPRIYYFQPRQMPHPISTIYSTLDEATLRMLLNRSLPLFLSAVLVALAHTELACS
jgi:hypothetical protein